MTVPLEGLINPAKQDKNVVFPDPFGPDNVVTLPASNASEIGANAKNESYFLLNVEITKFEFILFLLMDYLSTAKVSSSIPTYLFFF